LGVKLPAASGKTGLFKEAGLHLPASRQRGFA
jgi:hypothetical protein